MGALPAVVIDFREHLLERGQADWVSALALPGEILLSGGAMDRFPLDAPTLRSP